MRISNRLLGMQESPIRKLTPIAEKAKLDGKKVYHLNIGQPDIETPKEFFDAIKAFDEKVLTYSISQGLPELIDAMRDYYTKFDMHFDRDDILITNGGSEALLFSLIAVGDYNDEILVPEPFYTNYNGFSIPVGLSLKPITTYAEDGFKLPPASEIEKLINERTKAVLVSNPGNPTGRVMSTDEIETLKEIALKHDLFIISDEVYREFIYDGLSYNSFSTIDELSDRVIIIDSISKRFSACGARIGAVVSKNRDVIKNILKLCQSRLCAPTIEMTGAIELYKVDESYLRNVKAEYEKRRNIVYGRLSEIPGVICEKPSGAFYVIAKLPVVDAEDFVIWMLGEFSVNGETLMLAPAEGFYATEGLGRDEVRIAYILNENDLNASMNILKEALEAYPGKRK